MKVVVSHMHTTEFACRIKLCLNNELGVRFDNREVHFIVDMHSTCNMLYLPCLWINIHVTSTFDSINIEQANGIGRVNRERKRNDKPRIGILTALNPWPSKAQYIKHCVRNHHDDSQQWNRTIQLPQHLIGICFWEFVTNEAEADIHLIKLHHGQCLVFNSQVIIEAREITLHSMPLQKVDAAEVQETFFE